MANKLSFLAVYIARPATMALLPQMSIVGLCVINFVTMLGYLMSSYDPAVAIFVGIVVILPMWYGGFCVFFNYLGPKTRDRSAAVGAITANTALMYQIVADFEDRPRMFLRAAWAGYAGMAAGVLFYNER